MGRARVKRGLVRLLRQNSGLADAPGFVADIRFGNDVWTLRGGGACLRHPFGSVVLHHERDSAVLHEPPGLTETLVWDSLHMAGSGIRRR